MTTTSINKRVELVDTQSVTYIRQMTINIVAKECKPNTRLYAYFDGVRVDEYIKMSTGFTGDPIITDSDGGITATFNIPGFKFTTGEKIFSFSESEIFTPLEDVLPGTGTGCRATFTTNGVKNFFQTTVDTTNTVTVENVVRVELVDETLPPRYKDPVAQSFNTFGITGGCFILGIDLYFNTKDATVPVSVELRNMVNGYPTSTPLSTSAVVSLPAQYVNISKNSSIPTTFLFPIPIYLAEDSEYCFVVMTNSKLYNIFTSVLGEKSLEDGTIMFEQPYLGSVFKSQNNYTWTAAQYEDLKFSLWMAEFNISAPATLPMIGVSQNVIVHSDRFSTTSDSNSILGFSPHKHGFEVGSFVQLGVDTTGTYNGISGSNMTGTLGGVWPVTAVYNDYMFKFTVGANATSTGPIKHGGIVTTVYVNSGGSGYDENNVPSVTITGSGTGAIATAVIRDGKVVQILITNGGSGYTSIPTVTISGVSGSGATAVASLDIKFALSTNRVAHTVNPGFPTLSPQNTSVSSVMNTTTLNYDGGNLTTYSQGKDVQFNVNARTDLNQNIIISSTANELYKMSGNRSNKVTLELLSTNKNVSPMVDISTCSSMFYSNNINNQANDLILSTDSSGMIDSIVVANGGSGYTSAPTVIITSLPSDPGTGATATAVVTGGIVTAVNVVNSGSGYLYTPNITFSGGGTPTTVATAVSVMTKYNTELSAKDGRSFARYITKPNILSTISKGVRVLVTAYSSENTSFDVYIRTSLTSESLVHESKGWSLLKCNTQRNKSKNKSDLYEYEFYIYDLLPFDLYDMKIVMNSTIPYDVPIIDNYRAIIIT